MTTLTWIGICICVVHSAMFSGLNLALFSVTRLRLEVEVTSGNKAAEKVLRLRRDSHFLLTTILWGNVAFNTLLALLANSLLAGVYAFVFSTFIITFIGEIIPQAYFSRHALRMASLLAPILRFYQFVLYPMTRSTAFLLDWWLGHEGIQYFREHQLREVIKKHIEADEVDVDRLEGLGALNFLALDDLPISREGELLDLGSIIALPMKGDSPLFPPVTRSQSDHFLQQVQQSGKKWVALTDLLGQPQLVLDADGFLRDAFFGSGECNPMPFCHRPIVVTDENVAIGDILHQLRVDPQTAEDDVVDNDIILVWGKKKRIITGADILGRLLHGIVIRGSTALTK
jgi:metal transporter CNNM